MLAAQAAVPFAPDHREAERLAGESPASAQPAVRSAFDRARPWLSPSGSAHALHLVPWSRRQCCSSIPPRHDGRSSAGRQREFSEWRASRGNSAPVPRIPRSCRGPGRVGRRTPGSHAQRRRRRRRGLMVSELAAAPTTHGTGAPAGSLEWECENLGTKAVQEGPAVPFGPFGQGQTAEIEARRALLRPMWSESVAARRAELLRGLWDGAPARR